MSPRAEVFRSASGARVYRWPIEVFPDLVGYVHLVLADGMAALIDCGSGFGESNAMLEAGRESLRTDYGLSIGWEDLTHILITHAHIDHFGGLPYLQKRTSAQVGIHELDLRVLTNYESRLGAVDRRLGEFLAESGLASEAQDRLLALYRLNKHLFASVKVDFTFVASGMSLGRLQVHHVPGHCPGHVMFHLDDLLFVGDHVLLGVSPHLAPERISLSTGLGHYFDSLERTRRLAPDVSLALGGHGPPIDDLAGRIDAIQDLHAARLARILDFASDARTLAEISSELFPHASGYHELLALEEAGAHVEFLVERGYLSLDSPEATPRFARQDRSSPQLPALAAWAGQAHDRAPAKA